MRRKNGMKRIRILSILLALVMCLSMMPAGVWAEAVEPAEHEGHCVCGGNVSTGGHVCDASIPMWTAVGSETELKTVHDNAYVEDVHAYIYLTEDIELTEKLYLKCTVAICLNGHTLNLNNNSILIGSSDGARNAELSICDCQNTEHKFSVDSTTGLWTLDKDNGTKSLYGGVITGGGDKNGAIQVDYFDTKGGAELNLYSGNIAGNSGHGVNIYSNAGGFNMYGGTVTGNSVQEGNSQQGGGVFANGPFHMYGGKIQNNVVRGSSAVGGGVYISEHNNSGAENHFHLFGGKIAENRAIGYDSHYATHPKGGGIYIQGDNTWVEMKDISITGNTIEGNNSSSELYGAGIYHEGNTLRMSGATAVNNNSAVSNSGDMANSNIYLSKLEGSQLKIYVADTLTETDAIGIGMVSNGDFTLNCKVASKNAFFSDDDSYGIISNNDSTDPYDSVGLSLEKIHKHDISAACGTSDPIVFDKKLSEVDDITEADVILEIGNYFLDEAIKLGGKIQISGEVNICLNGNVLTGNGSSAVFDVQENSTLKICDCGSGAGTITGGGQSGICNAGSLYIYGGKITGNSAATPGGGIYNAGDLTLSGKPVISGNTGGNLYLDADGTITIASDFKPSTKVGVSADVSNSNTVMICDWSSSTAPVTYFSSDIEGYEILKYDGKALLHKHVYEYTANGVVLTETCSGCGHSATAKISTSGSLTYDGESKEVSVTFDDKWAGSKEYTISYKDEKGNTLINEKPLNKGTYTATVSFTDINYDGEVEMIYTVSTNDPTGNVEISYDKPQYNGSASVSPVFSVKYNGKELKGGVDYTISGTVSSNTIGEHTVTINFTGNYSGSKEYTWTLAPRAYSESEFVISYTEEQLYTGEGIVLTDLVVKFGEIQLSEGTDYDLEYSLNTNPGTATVKISFKGNYSSSVTKEFTIAVASLPEDISLTDIFTEYNEAIWFRGNEPSFSTAGDWNVSKATPVGDETTISYTTEGKAVENTVYVKKDGKVYKTTIVYNYDKTAPVISGVTGIPAEWTNQNVTLTVNGANDTVSGLPVENAYSFDNGKTWQNESYKTFEKNVSDIIIKVRDIAGNEYTHNAINIEKIDKAQPTVSVIALEGTEGLNEWYTSAVTVKVDLTDEGGAGVKTWEYSIDGGNEWKTGNGTTFTVNDNGNYSGLIRVRATDSAENVSVEVTVNDIMIDAAVPDAPEVSAKAGGADYNGGWTAENIIFALENTPTESDHSHYQIKIGNDEWTNMDGESFTHDTNTASEGISYQFRAVNNAGIAGTASDPIVVKRSAMTADELSATMYGSGDLDIGGSAVIDGWYTNNVTISVSKKSTVGNGNNALSATTYYKLYKYPDTNSEAVVLQGDSISIPSDGDWTLEIWTEDEAGNKTEPYAANIKVDTTKPDINGTITGNPTSWTNDNCTVGFTVSDATSDITSVTVSRDGAPYVVKDNSSFVADQNGTYVITVTDRAGNVSTKEVVVDKIDKTDPVVGETITGNPINWTKDDCTVGFTVSDEASAIASVTVSCGGVPYVVSNNNSFVADQNGTYVITVTDKAGNVSTKEIVVDKIDKTNPVIEDAITGNPINWTNNDCTVGFIVSDTISDVESVTVSRGGISYDVTDKSSFVADQNGTYVITVTDRAGNVSTKEVVVDKIDKTNPVIGETIEGNPVNWTKNDCTMRFTVSDDTSDIKSVTVSRDGVSYVVSNNSSFVADQNGRYVITVTDKAGNVSTKEVVVDKIDKTKPVIDEDIIGIPVGWTNESWTVKFETSDNMSDIATVTVARGEESYAVNANSFVADQNGTYVITVTDNAGNISTKEVVVDKIDKTNPVIEDAITGNPTSWTKENCTVGFTVSDATSGIASVTVSRGGISYDVTGKSSFVADQNGTYIVTAKDNAGNATTKEVVVDKIDKTEPTVDISPVPDNEAWYGATEFSVTMSDGENGKCSGIKEAVVTDGKSAESTDIKSTAKFSCEEGSAGKYEYTVKVTDAVGNYTTKTVSINYDPRIDEFMEMMSGLNESSSYTDLATAKSWYNQLSYTAKQHIKANIEADLKLTDLEIWLQDKAEDALAGLADAVESADTIQTIRNAESTYNMLPDDLKVQVEKEVLQKLQNKIADADAAEMVKNALESASTYDDMKAAVEAYDLLTADQKALISDIESRYNSLKIKVENIDEVVKAINNANKRPFSAKTDELIVTAEAGYEALSNELKGIFPDVYKDILDELIRIKSAAGTVESLIEGLPEEYSDSAKGNIIAAKKAYEVLSDDEQKLVSGGAKAKLDALYNSMLRAASENEKAKYEFEAKVVSVKAEPSLNSIKSLISMYEALSEEAKNALSPETENDYADLVAAKPVIEAIMAVGADNITASTLADTGYNALSDVRKVIVDKATGNSAADIAAAVDVISKIEAIPIHDADASNDDGSPDLTKCGSELANENHITKIKAAKNALEQLTGEGRKLISNERLDRLNKEYISLMSYLEYIHIASTRTTEVEITGLTEVVLPEDSEIPGTTTVVEVVMEDSKTPFAPKIEDKHEMLSVDIGIIATTHDAEGNLINRENVNPGPGGVMVKLKVPSGYKLDTLELWHIKDNGSRHRIHDYNVIREGNADYVVFKMDSFSHIVFMAEKTSVSGSSGTGSAVCESKCPICGGCTDPECKDSKCKDKCNVPDMNFTDVADGKWYTESIRYVYHKGLMNGVAADKFAPSGDTTRGMLMTILARMSGVDTSSSDPWYQVGLDWAVANEVSDGTNPESVITREQLVTMLYRNAGSPEADITAYDSFADADAVSSWAEEAMAWAVENGIVTGIADADGNLSLDPQGTTLRCQMAAMLQRYDALVDM